MGGFSGATGSVTVNGAKTGVKNWAITPSAKYLDKTSMDSAGWEETGAGNKSWEGSFETLDFPADWFSGIVAVEVVSGSVSFKTGSGQPGGSGTEKTYVGSIVIGRAAIRVPHDDLIGWTVEFKGNGPLTIS